MLNRAVWRAVAAVAFVGCGAGGAAAAPGPTPVPFVLDSTYAQRVAASPRNRPVEVDSLVLPHAHALNVLPQPVFVGAGGFPLEYPDRDQVIWRSVPRTALHEPYLEKRKELLAAGDAKGLVDWCVRNNLPECAEFELRCLLVKFKHYRERGYLPLCRQWVKYAESRRTEYAFPLPARGVWSVSGDQTGHHRIKAGAAFAWDLVITRNGKPFAGEAGNLGNYFAWDQPVLAQADGVVRLAEDTYPDMPIGRSGGFDRANSVIVDYGGGILAIYGHVRQGSVTVRPGDRVAAGQELARVGNSGASGMPHLHFTMLDHAYFSIRGRFRYEMMRSGGWRRVDGEDLAADACVRNVE